MNSRQGINFSCLYYIRREIKNGNTEKSIIDIKVDDIYTIYVFKGTLSKNDIVIKYPFLAWLEANLGKFVVTVDLDAWKNSSN